jgi:hypothetical protein
MRKFSLRDLFSLVLVVAILCAWWVDRRRLVRENARTNSALEAATFLIHNRGAPTREDAKKWGGVFMYPLEVPENAGIGLTIKEVVEVSGEPLKMREFEMTDPGPIRTPN